MNQTLFSRSSLIRPAKHDLTAAEEAHQKEQSAKRRAKRRKPRWKDRVAPAAPVEEPEDVIDEAALTRCTRCPAHRNQPGRFRPLIDNGCYLCDDCYRSEFPATAMLDEENNDNEVVALGKRVSNLIRNKIVDTAADVMGVTRLTPEEEIQRTRQDQEQYPSEVECRMCLERAIFRRCCDGYYCHLCYYKSGRCPGCEIEAPLTGIAAAGLKPDPGNLAVGLSWALSFLLVIITAATLALVYFNATTTPTSFWGHACRGWLPTCNLEVCIDHDGGIGYGAGGEFLPAAEPYKVCDRETSPNQVISSACVYDKEMYSWSNHLLGYDLCVSSPREEDSRPRNVTYAEPLLLYSGNQSGVYIFDDDFEQPWKNVSSPWSEIINGERSDSCGVNGHPPARGNYGGFAPALNKNALVFTGVRTRHGITAGLNIEHGGRVEFYLKMGPSTRDDNSECKTAFSDVILEYSVLPEKWVTFGTYPAWKYRGEQFQFISQDIPTSSYSNNTRFRFRQPTFDVLRDHWAIDDVMIFANLKTDWEKSAQFKERQNQVSKDILFAKCCYNTEQCSVFDKKKTNFDDKQCDKIPGFDSSKSNSRLKLSELLMLYLALTALFKTVYGLIAWRFRSRALALTKKNYNTSVFFEPRDDELFSRQTFHSKSDLSWQYTIATILLGALLCTIYRLLSALMVFQCMSQKDELFCDTDGTFIVSCLVAGFFDTRVVVVLLSQVFCIERPWKRKEQARKGVNVVVDLHPDQGFMSVGSSNVPLSEVSEIQRQTTAYNWLLAILYTLAGMPLALSSLTLQSFDLPSGFESCASLLGCMAILRELVGPSIFAKLFLSMKWVLAGYKDRDELGRSVLRKGLPQQAMIGSFVPVVTMSILGRRPDISAFDNFIIFILCFVFGGLSGLVLGIMHGLPVACMGKFTGWPSVCCSVSYYDRVQCPCLFSCTYCGEMHSRQMLLVIALDDMLVFKRMLQGNLSKMPER